MPPSLGSPARKSSDSEESSRGNFYERNAKFFCNLKFLLFSMSCFHISYKHTLNVPSKNLTLALSQALIFFYAQNWMLPKNSPVKFRGDSRLLDGNSGNSHVDLEGGFYYSSNNIKFSFTTTYIVTLLSWIVIEYHEKYADIGELKHVKDIIKWGSDYLLNFFPPQNATSDAIIFTSNETQNTPNDINCWQRSEDMTYQRPVSQCGSTASDLAGEIVEALSATSLVFKEDTKYSNDLVEATEKLFEIASKVDSTRDARKFYNSTGFEDELLWEGTWLFFATGNTSFLNYSTTGTYNSSVAKEKSSNKGVFLLEQQAHS
ncbi:hypothetical protein I3760_16G016300 [Carya illinoinensis]|nr:hypothetical protein I3760_16G016300 [Carya illinoinensis]